MEIACSAFAALKLHLGVTGSVSAYKAVDLMRILQRQGVQVSVTLTASACKFVTPLLFESLSASPVYSAMFSEAGMTASPFAHLEPAGFAHTFAIIPATATTLSRLAHGMADEILSAQALAFPGKLLLAPAMNPHMWANPATVGNVEILRQRGHTVIPPADGPVACGDTGAGKLPPVDELALHCLRALLRASARNDLEGRKVLVTLGPTREPFDLIRFWSNSSTGLMGASLAVAAWLRGAEVHAVHGPLSTELPPVIHAHPCTTAQSMLDTCRALMPDMDLGVFSAAVADFAPEYQGKTKFKKEGREQGFTLAFTSTPDVLATLAAEKVPGQIFVGFAAESDNIVENARGKLKRKHLDMIVANRIGIEGEGFASPTNAVHVITSAQTEALPLCSKFETAWQVLDRVCAL